MGELGFGEKGVAWLGIISGCFLFFVFSFLFFVFFQAEDGIRDLVRSRGLGDVYKRQSEDSLIIIAL